MKVKELIAELAKCPLESDVRFFVDWEDRRSVSALSPEDSNGDVLLGDKNLPPEAFARDVKYG